jgi:hypothetical protein
MKFGVIWLLFLGVSATVFGIIEYESMHNKRTPGEPEQDTLSATLRRWLHTDTKLGRTIWAVCWAAAAAWFGAHILSPGLVWWP